MVQIAKDQPQVSEALTITLSTGRTVSLREMTVSDLIFIEGLEKSQKSSSDTENTLKIIERLGIGDRKITVPELKKLNLIDFRAISELMTKAGGVEDPTDEDDEY